MKILFGFTTWCCLDVLLAKLIILPAASNKFKRGKTPQNPVWIMLNKVLYQPSANFNHHKLLKSLSSISPSIRHPPSTQGWPQNKKQLLKPLFVLVAGWSSISILWRCWWRTDWQAHLQLLGLGDIFHSNRCFYLFSNVCFLKLKKKPNPKTVLLQAKSPLQQKFFHLHKNA